MFFDFLGLVVVPSYRGVRYVAAPGSIFHPSRVKWPKLGRDGGGNDFHCLQQIKKREANNGERRKSGPRNAKRGACIKIVSMYVRQRKAWRDYHSSQLFY